MNNTAILLAAMLSTYVICKWLGSSEEAAMFSSALCVVIYTSIRDIGDE